MIHGISMSYESSLHILTGCKPLTHILCHPSGLVPQIQMQTHLHKYITQLFFSINA